MKYRVPLSLVPFGLPVEFEGLSGSYLRLRQAERPGVVSLMCRETGVVSWMNPNSERCRPLRNPADDPRIGDSMGPINIGGVSHNFYYHVVEEKSEQYLCGVGHRVLGISYKQGGAVQFWCSLERWRGYSETYPVRHAGLDFWLRP